MPAWILGLEGSMTEYRLFRLDGPALQNILVSLLKCLSNQCLVRPGVAGSTAIEYLGLLSWPRKCGQTHEFHVELQSQKEEEWRNREKEKKDKDKGRNAFRQSFDSQCAPVSANAGSSRLPPNSQSTLLPSSQVYQL